jgi:hypothetical protein
VSAGPYGSPNLEKGGWWGEERETDRETERQRGHKRKINGGKGNRDFILEV